MLVLRVFYFILLFNSIFYRFVTIRYRRPCLPLLLRYHEQLQYMRKVTLYLQLTLLPGLVGWLVGCFGLNGPLRQYFSLYRAVSQREGERKEKWQMREKMSKHPTPSPTASAIGPRPTIIQISRTPRHWKFTQHLRTTRPPHLVSYRPSNSHCNLSEVSQ